MEDKIALTMRKSLLILSTIFMAWAIFDFSMSITQFIVVGDGNIDISWEILLIIAVAFASLWYVFGTKDIKA